MEDLEMIIACQELWVYLFYFIPKLNILLIVLFIFFVFEASESHFQALSGCAAQRADHEMRMNDPIN